MEMASSVLVNFTYIAEDTGDIRNNRNVKLLITNIEKSFCVIRSPSSGFIKKVTSDNLFSHEPDKSFIFR